MLHRSIITSYFTKRAFPLTVFPLIYLRMIVLKLSRNYQRPLKYQKNNKKKFIKLKKRFFQQNHPCFIPQQSVQVFSSTYFINNILYEDMLSSPSSIFFFFFVLFFLILFYCCCFFCIFFS